LAKSPRSKAISFWAKDATLNAVGRRLESLAIRVDPETGWPESAKASRKPLIIRENIVGSLRVSLRPLPWCAPIFILEQSFRVQS
jgi:hypothetical protein